MSRQPKPRRKAAPVPAEFQGPPVNSKSGKRQLFLARGRAKSGVEIRPTLVDAAPSGPLLAARLLQRQTPTGPCIFELMARYQGRGWTTKYCGHSLTEANRALAGIVEGLDLATEPLTVLAEWALDHELPTV